MLPPFLDPTRPQRAAALVGGRTVSLAELEAGAQALGRVINQGFDPMGRHTTLGFGRDRLAFAVALLGSWEAGRTPLLPEHSRRDALGALALHPATGLFVHDTGTGRGLFATPFAAACSAGGGPAQPGAALALPGELLLCAGRRPPPGTRHSPRPADAGLEGLCFVGWNFAELEAELEALARALGARVGGPVLSTLAPCYGPAALAAVLLPLALGRPFVAEVPAGPGGPQLARAVLQARTASGATVLVTSLGHLFALWALEPGALAGFELVLVVDQRLPAALVEHFEARHGVALLGLLGVEPGPTQAELELLIALLFAGSAPDAEVRHSPTGLRVLAAAPAGGRERLAGLLGEGPVELRVLERLERDPNGNLAPSGFLRPFGLGGRGQPLRLGFHPEADPVGSAQHWSVPQDSDWFEGHFPGYPVLAGAVQLAELVLPALARHLGREPRVRAFSALKFLTPIQPGDRLRLDFSPAGPEPTFEFCIHRGAQRCTQGRVHLVPDSRGIEVHP